MKQHSVKATIFTTDSLKIKYAVCQLEQIHYEDETFEYIFTPYYSVIDLLSPITFQGIPGLNLDLRKTKYIRRNKIPTFIYERTPQENREDLWEHLDSVGLEFLDHLEWLIRSDYEYTGDNLSVSSYKIPQNQKSVNDVNPGDTFTLNGVAEIADNNYRRLKLLLAIIVNGAFLTAGYFTIDDNNRKSMHELIYVLYEMEVKKRTRRQSEGIESAKSKKKYAGRKKIDVSLPLLSEVIEQLDRKEITIDQAMNRLGLKSRSTLYRRIREFNDAK